MKKNINETVRSTLASVDEQIKLMNENNEREEAMVKAELQNIRRQMELAPAVDELETLRSILDSKKNLKKKSWIYSIAGIFLSCSSLLMSVAGISGATSVLNFKEIFMGPSKYFAITMFMLQFAMTLFSLLSYEFKTHHYKSYSKVRYVQFMVTMVSITCNYLYLSSVMASNDIFAMLLAISTDIGAITMNELACVAKNRLYSTNSVESDNSTTFLEKLKIAVFGKYIASVNIKFNIMKELIKKSETSKDISIVATATTADKKTKMEDMDMFSAEDEFIHSSMDTEDMYEENIC